MRFGPQDIPTTGQSISQYDDRNPTRYSLFLRNRGGSSQVVTIVLDGSDSRTLTIVPNVTALFRNLPLYNVSVDGGTVVAYIAPEPEYLDIFGPTQ